MLIYKDIISGDELASDSYPTKLVQDFAFEFEGKTISVCGGIDDSLIGGNASAEEAVEVTEDAEEKKINIVHAHNLVATSFTKKDYLTYLKGHIKKVMAELEKTDADRAKQFKSKVESFVKDYVLPNFKNWEFYTGESMDPDGVVMLMDYREDGLTPYFVIFKDVVIEEKQ